MDQFAKYVESASNWFALPLVSTVMAVGIFFTVRLRFVQIFRFREAIRETVASVQTSANGAISPLQAFMTALAATIGVGNIVGVGTAIVKGGPGALFWIWCYGFFAMATKFSEASLGMHFRVVQGETVLAGPMYYLRDGLKSRWLAWVFALVAGLAVLLTTPFTQPNSVASAIRSQLEQQNLSLGSFSIRGQAFSVDQLIVGIVLAVLTWLVVIRGVKALGRAAEKLSPLKVGLYLVGGLVVIITHIDQVPNVIGMVFSQAFSSEAIVGGTFGWVMMRAIRYGVARGVYANEAGYGTAAVAYGTAKSDRPEQQGLAAMIDVFIVSFITSSISALSILLTGVWQTSADGAVAVPAAFNAAIPVAGGWMVAVSLFLFGYTVLIGWGYYGETYFEYLFGPRIIMPYRWFYCLLIPFGALAKVDLVWNWGDIFNGLQVFPNVIGLIGLSGIAASYAVRGRTGARGVSNG